MYFADALTLDAPRRTKDGFLAVRARAARTGVYQYSGREVDPDNKHGLRDKASVNVLRDDGTVFDERAVRSFIGKPVTDDHPHEAVTRDNWRDHARGTIMGAMRDGDYLAFDLLLTDGPTIDKVESGKRELSNGYGADIEFGDFKATDGTVCQARQSKITGGNHVALVDRGRAGPDCRIADAAPAFALCDSLPSNLFDSLKTETTVPKNITLDGLTVDVSNPETAEKTINTLRDQRDANATKLTDADKKATADAATIVAKDAEIAKLTKQVEDSKLTPQQMRDAGKAYTDICDKAKAAGITVTDAMNETDIMRAVVDKGMGVAAKDYSDEHIAIAFRALTNGTPTTDRHTAPSGTPMVANDTKTVRDLAFASRY